MVFGWCCYGRAAGAVGAVGVGRRGSQHCIHSLSTREIERVMYVPVSLNLSGPFPPF